MPAQELRYIESNPKVCGGQWVFKGTRIMVWCVRQQLELGVPLEEIVREWRGDVSLEAIEEVRRARVTDPEIVIDSD